MRRSAFYLPDTPTEVLTGARRELQALERAQRYDVLPTKYLVAGMGRYGDEIRTRLLHAQAVRISPEAKKYGYAKRHKFYPVQITEVGQKLLSEHGHFAERIHGKDHFAHKYYRCIAEFLFDYAAELTPNLKAKTLSDLLADERCPSQTREDKYAHRLPLAEAGHIVPDFYRAYDYRDGLATTHFFVEVDRNMEPLTSQADRQNIEDKIRNYNRFLGANGPRTRYGVNQATVLWLTTKHYRKDGILKLAAQSALPQRHAVRVMPDFTEGLPAPSAFMVAEPWARAGEPLDILQVLKATAAKKEQGSDPRRENRPHQRAG